MNEYIFIRTRSLLSIALALHGIETDGFSGFFKKNIYNKNMKERNEKRRT